MPLKRSRSPKRSKSPKRSRSSSLKRARSSSLKRSRSRSTKRSTSSSRGQVIYYTTELGSDYVTLHVIMHNLVEPNKSILYHTMYNDTSMAYINATYGRFNKSTLTFSPLGDIAQIVDNTSIPPSKLGKLSSVTLVKGTIKRVLKTLLKQRSYPDEEVMSPTLPFTGRPGQAPGPLKVLS